MQGRCYYCNKELNERTIKKHMKSCTEMKKVIERKSQVSKGNRNHLIISIKDKYNKNTYCIYVSIDENLQLAHLDKFIRDVWVECCGHLSYFKINGSSYNDNSDDLYQMNVKLKDVLSINQKFEYDYDFGSTTELILEVVDRIKVPKNFSQIEIIARNNPIQHKCNECKKEAKYFNWQEEKYYCETCAQAIDEEELEEVGYTNSSRDGVCGYFGDEDNEKIYLPGNDKKYKIDNKNKPVTDDDLEGFWGFDDFENLDGDDELDDMYDFHELYEDDILDNGVLEESVEKIIESGMNEEEIGTFIANTFMLDNIKRHGKINDVFVKGKCSFDIYELIHTKTKNDIAEIGEHLGIKISLSLTKAKMIDKLMAIYEDAVIETIKSIGQEDYDLLRRYLSNGGIWILSKDNEEEGISSTYFCDFGILYPFLKDNKPAFIMPEVTQKILKQIDGFEIRKTIKENTKILNMFKGMINAYGVLSIKDVLNLFKRYGIDILESKLMALILRLINVPSMVYYVIDEKNDIFFLNYEIQSYEAIRNDIDKDLDYSFIEEKTLIIMGEEDYFDKTKFGEKFIKEFAELFGLEKSESLDIMHMMATDIQAYDVDTILEGFLKPVEGKVLEKDKAIIYNVIDDFTENIPLWIHKGHTKKEIKSKDKQKYTVTNKVRLGRNDPCPCGSGKKYKKCCGKNDNVIQLGKV